MLAQCKMRIILNNYVCAIVYKYKLNYCGYLETMELCLCRGVRAGLLKVMVQLVKMVYCLRACIVQ